MEKKYKVILSLRSYKTDTNKYKDNGYVRIHELDNISFDTVLNDLNKRLINMDYMGTDVLLTVDNKEVREIIDAYTMDELVEDIRIPGILNINIKEEKLEKEEIIPFLDGVLEILKDQNSKVLALGYEVKHNKFKLVKEDSNKKSIIIEFVVIKLKEIYG